MRRLCPPWIVPVVGTAVLLVLALVRELSIHNLRVGRSEPTIGSGEDDKRHAPELSSVQSAAKLQPEGSEGLRSPLHRICSKILERHQFHNIDASYVLDLARTGIDGSRRLSEFPPLGAAFPAGAIHDEMSALQSEFNRLIWEKPESFRKLVSLCQEQGQEQRRRILMMYLNSPVNLSRQPNANEKLKPFSDPDFLREVFYQVRHETDPWQRELWVGALAAGLSLKPALDKQEVLFALELVQAARTGYRHSLSQPLYCVVASYCTEFSEVKAWILSESEPNLHIRPPTEGTIQHPADAYAWYNRNAGIATLVWAADPQDIEVLDIVRTALLQESDHERIAAALSLYSTGKGLHPSTPGSERYVQDLLDAFAFQKNPQYRSLIGLRILDFDTEASMRFLAHYATDPTIPEDFRMGAVKRVETTLIYTPGEIRKLAHVRMLRESLAMIPNTPGTSESVTRAAQDTLHALDAALDKSP